MDLPFRMVQYLTNTYTAEVTSGIWQQIVSSNRVMIFNDAIERATTDQFQVILDVREHTNKKHISPSVYLSN